jgi:hypothetical protein
MLSLAFGQIMAGLIVKGHTEKLPEALTPASQLREGLPTRLRLN